MLFSDPEIIKVYHEVRKKAYMEIYEKKYRQTSKYKAYLQTSKCKANHAARQNMRQKTPEGKMYRKMYRQTPKQKAYQKAYRQRPEYRTSQHKYRQSTKGKTYQNRWNKQIREENKRLVFGHYGGKCSWPGCNVIDTDMLQIDHINGGGTKHRKELKSTSICHWLIMNNYPPGFRLLCANHNWKHRANMDRAKALKERKA